jgi:hypothetical protein
MPKNENNNLPNLHTIYVSASGGGKNQAMNMDLAGKYGSDRFVIWDPHNLYKCQSFDDLGDFAAAHIAGSHKSLRYNGVDTPVCFEMFCRIVWELLDGEEITYVLIDELADSSDTIAKATSSLGKLMRGGRKYGARIHCTAVSAAEISKTVWKQCVIKWIGVQGDQADIDRAKKVLMIDNNLITELKNLEFWVKDAEREVSKKIVKYKSPPFLM